MTTTTDPSVSHQDLPRRIGFWGASAIMIGIVIGSGIFASPTSIAKQMGSPVLILSLWLLGGVIAFFGALTYSELATRYPRSGGVYVFLREGLGRPVAFVFGWTYMLLTKPFAAAGIAIVGAEHLHMLLGYEGDVRLTTAAVIVFFTAINTPGVRGAMGVAAVLTSLKVAALLAIVLIGVALGQGNAANFVAQEAPKPIYLALAPVLAAIMWTYDGWSDVGAIAGEVKEPQRTLPRVYLIGTAAVTALYMAVNAIYFWLIPLEQMKTSSTLAPVIMEMLVGPAGATVVTVLVVVSTFGATHGSIMTGARVTFAQARDGLLFKALGHVHQRWQTPAVALWVQAALSVLAVYMAGSFQKLASGFVFTMWIFYGLAGLTLFVFRARGDAAAPFRCPGYPVVPALFVASAFGVVVLQVVSEPLETLPWMVVLAAGFPVYWLWTRFFGGGRPRAA